MGISQRKKVKNKKYNQTTCSIMDEGNNVERKQQFDTDMQRID